MADLTQEQYEQLPEFIRDDYKEVDGVYKHAGMMKVKQTANALDTELKQVKGNNAELSERMTALEQDQKAKIDQAKEDALKEAKSSSNIEEIERLHSEQMADLEARVKERTRQETLDEISLDRAKEKANNTAKRIAESTAIDKDAIEPMIALLAPLVKPDDNGNVIFMNEDGTASSLDEAGFVAELEKSNRFKRLIKKEPPTRGGGLANGSGYGGGRTANETNKKAEEAKKNGDLNGFLAASLKIN